MMRQRDDEPGAAQVDHGAHGVGGVEAEGLACGEPCLGVLAFGDAGRVASLEVGEHAIEAAPDRTSELLERLEPRSRRPGEPLVQTHAPP